MFDFFVDRGMALDFLVDKTGILDFCIDKGDTFDFYINEYSVPIYANLSMINKLKIDSSINGVRYIRLNELKSISLADLKGKSLREISREYI